jgi:Ankyrin repeats (3 copies)
VRVIMIKRMFIFLLVLCCIVFNQPTYAITDAEKTALQNLFKAIAENKIATEDLELPDDIDPIVINTVITQNALFGKKKGWLAKIKGLFGGADDNPEMNVLVTAILSKNLEAASNLLKIYPDILDTNVLVGDLTPLMYAVAIDQPELVDMLLEFKTTDVNKQNSNGQTALDIALENNNDALAEKLKNAGGTAPATVEKLIQNAYEGLEGENDLFFKHIDVNTFIPTDVIDENLDFPKK